MPRWVWALIALSAALSSRSALADDLKKERKDPIITKEEVPKEEDENLTTKEYSFNPLQAEKEVRVGEYYFKKGSYRAAAQRFREATKWNQGYGEAWLRLGETAEKQKDTKTAKEAYAKYLEVAPDAKDAAEVRKKLERIK